MWTTGSRVPDTRKSPGAGHGARQEAAAERSPRHAVTCSWPALVARRRAEPSVSCGCTRQPAVFGRGQPTGAPGPRPNRCWPARGRGPAGSAGGGGDDSGRRRAPRRPCGPRSRARRRRCPRPRQDADDDRDGDRALPRVGDEEPAQHEVDERAEDRAASAACSIVEVNAPTSSNRPRTSSQMPSIQVSAVAAMPGPGEREEGHDEGDQRHDAEQHALTGAGALLEDLDAQADAVDEGPDAQEDDERRRCVASGHAMRMMPSTMATAPRRSSSFQAAVSRSLGTSTSGLVGRAVGPLHGQRRRRPAPGRPWDAPRGRCREPGTAGVAGSRRCVGGGSGVARRPRGGCGCG